MYLIYAQINEEEETFIDYRSYRDFMGSLANTIKSSYQVRLFGGYAHEQMFYP